MKVLSRLLLWLSAKTVTKRERTDSKPKILSKKITTNYMQILEKAYTELAIKEISISQYVKTRSAEIIKEMEEENKKSTTKMRKAMIDMVTTRCIKGKMRLAEEEIRYLEDKIKFHNQVIDNYRLSKNYHLPKYHLPKGEELLEEIIIARLTAELVSRKTKLVKLLNLLEHRDLIFLYKYVTL